MKDPIETTRNLEKAHFFLRSSLLMINHFGTNTDDFIDLYKARNNRFYELYFEELKRLNTEDGYWWDEIGERAEKRYKKKIYSFYENNPLFPFLGYLKEEIGGNPRCGLKEEAESGFLCWFNYTQVSKFDPEYIVTILRKYWFNQTGCKTREEIHSKCNASLFVAFSEDHSISINEPEFKLVHYHPWNIEIYISTAGIFAVRYFEDASFFDRIDNLEVADIEPEKEAGILKTKSLKEYLQYLIDELNIWDATGKITPDTLWRLTCFHHSDLEGKYELDGEYKGKEDDLLSTAIHATAAGLATQNAKAPLSMRKRHESHS